ncbi:MAG: N-acetylmuramoyl-L-alanine amidase [Candidatus Gracilibacteria bacterium]
MKKVFLIFLVLFVPISSTFALNDIKIISRDEWGADESYRYIDSPEWVQILKDREKAAEKEKNTVYTQEQVDVYHERQEKLRQMDEILLNDYGEEIAVDIKIYSENGNTLAWPITKTKKVSGIVIHHTVSDYEDSIEGINRIYKYHALTKEWGDIGYNFLIGKNGEIFEGRAGGDYVTAAHDKWNNRANIGIAVIGNYSAEPVNINQYNALKALTKYLIVKYDIDLTEKSYFHYECKGDDCEKPLKTELKYPIIGHRDAGYTACPGEKLYKQLDILRRELLKDPISIANVYRKKIFNILGRFSDEKLIDVLVRVEDDLEETINSNKLKLKGFIIDYFEYKNDKKIVIVQNEDENIKIKLSYPNNDAITIKTGDVLVDITRIGNSIYIKGKKFNVLKIPKKDPESILKITSWNRIPTWDTGEKYNDNKFRGDLIIYAKNNKLIVVNSLEVEDYLKGLGEVSNSEVTEKIKTIIIAARSYATRYTTKDRKFPGEFYDGVDDPNIFQKYLGYGLEERSPNINKIVEETKGKVITYEGKLIKPWYFSNSDGQTLSFYEYCNVRYSDEICSVEAKKYPYFQSVVDKGSEGKTKAGHGVGISGAGVSYFASKGWSYDMIIKYFLKGVDVL